MHTWPFLICAHLFTVPALFSSAPKKVALIQMNCNRTLLLPDKLIQPDLSLLLSSLKPNKLYLLNMTLIHNDVTV